MSGAPKISSPSWSPAEEKEESPKLELIYAKPPSSLPFLSLRTYTAPKTPLRRGFFSSPFLAADIAKNVLPQIPRGKKELEFEIQNKIRRFPAT